MESLEIQIKQVLECLSDNTNHPEIWENIREIASDGRESLLELINYLQLLISLPQTDEVNKLLTVLQAVCLAHCGDTQLAREKLTILQTNHSANHLIAGALSHVQSLM